MIKGKAEFAAVMQAIKNYGTDPNAIDLPRLLRLPGTYHVKGKRQLVKIVDAKGQRYSREAILKAFIPARTRIDGAADHQSASVASNEHDLARVADHSNSFPPKTEVYGATLEWLSITRLGKH